jgi:hypothetical protein
MDLREVACEDDGWLQYAQDHVQWRTWARSSQSVELITLLRCITW